MDKPSGSNQPSARILYVEDHEDTINAMSRLMRIHGFGVDSARSVARARELSALNLYDLVICDLGLPDGDGCALFAEINEAHRTPGIALTGNTLADEDRIKLAGFAHVAIKPVAFDAILSAVQKMLGIDRATLATN